MMKKFIGMFVAIAMIMSIIPCNMALAAKNVTTSNGSVIVYAKDAEYTSSISSLTDGYSSGSDSNSTGSVLTAKGGSSGTPSGSKLSFNVTTDEAGRYSLWVRAKGTNETGATWFSINGSEYERKSLDTGNAWGWVKLNGGIYLASGQTVSIKLYPKNEGHKLDEFIFTNENSYMPDGVVTNASSIQPMALSTSEYGMPTITPPSATHPRVMFKQGDVSRIITNSTKNQNSMAAKPYFDNLVTQNFSGVQDYSNPETKKKGNNGIENLIEAYAFYYALYKNDTELQVTAAEKGGKAVTELINYLKTVEFTDAGDTYARDMGCVVFKASEVYDWCYDLLSLEQKQEIIALCEGIMSGMECGYPNIGQGNITGHGTEAQILRDMLAFSIAVYDERPDIYNHIMGRIQKEMVPARNYYYASNSVNQGSSYGYYRFYWDLWAQLLVKAMTGQDLFNADDMSQVAYYAIYNRRPDGRMFIQGDDASLAWEKYNAHSGQTSFLAGALFANPYFKGEYRTTRGSDDFSNTNFNNDKSFTSVLWLIINDPNVAFKKGEMDNGVSGRADLPLSRYFGSPNGTILAKTGWDMSRSGSSGLNVASAMMKIGERYASNHEHLDAGTFQLFYKGMLASDSGVYTTYGNEHDLNYAKRTIAHNGLLIYDENERFNITGQDASNDGGQRYVGEANTYNEWMSDNYKRGTVLDHEIAADNSYSYIKGDITPAYSSSKAAKVVRSMSFLQTGNADVPAVMVVYDKVVSKTAAQTKKFVLHTQAQPEVNGTQTTVVNKNTITYSATSEVTYNGRMVMDTVLPENPSITAIGGEGHEYEVNGTNYPPENNESYNEGGWGRIEITPSTADTSTEFLNVLQVSDGDSTAHLDVDSITGSSEEGYEKVVGARIGQNVVMFSGQSGVDGRVQNKAAFTVPGGATSGIKITVFGVKAGVWTVRKNGSIIAQPEATDDGGTISFTGGSDNYELTYLGEGGYEALSSDNVSTGYVTEVKGATANSPWTRTVDGGGQSRASVIMQTSADVTSATALIYAYYDASKTPNSSEPGRYAHSKFSFQCTNGFQIRIRDGAKNNIQWMNFSSDGTISGNGSDKVDYGVTWTPKKTTQCDIIADLQTGTGYLYIDGKLVSKSFNLPKDGKWYGYSIYTAGAWKSGDKFTWVYCGQKNIGYTLFKDTANHIVTLEDVTSYPYVGISDKLDSSSDPGLILSDSKMQNYFIPQSAATVAYPTEDSVTMSLNEPVTDYACAAFMMSKFYHDYNSTGKGATINVAGKYLHVSFDQTITDATDAQIRLRSNGKNITDLGFHNQDGMMAVSTASLKNAKKLDKAFGEEFKIDILIDITGKKAYYFVDGMQIGTATSGLTTSMINDLRYYIKGDEGTVTLENMKYRVYSSLKSFDELSADIKGLSVWWPKGDENILDVDIEEDVIGMCVTGKNVFGAEVSSGTKIIAAAFANNNSLVDFQSWDYTDGDSNSEVVFENAGDIKTIKIFCWYDDIEPVALMNEFKVSDYVN